MGCIERIKYAQCVAFSMVIRNISEGIRIRKKAMTRSYPSAK